MDDAVRPLTPPSTGVPSSAPSVPSSDENRQAAAWRQLALVGLASCLLYLLMAWLSLRFDPSSDTRQRPILETLAIVAAVFALHLVALTAALRCSNTWRLASLCVVFAVAFRIILLFSTPIQEIDIYRYLWDGAVLAEGVSPFCYSPAEVLSARSSGTTDEDLRRLVQLCDRSPALADVLSRVHYGELPTVYPPVSQLVFGSAALVTPNEASVSTHMLVMKALLTVFDIATCMLVVVLLAALGRHVGWTIAYAWSPLVLKEIANSGHLDSIAVCLTTAALVCLAIPLSARWEQSSSRGTRLAVVAFGLLALAVGAKLYPIVLLPLFVVHTSVRLGWRATAGGTALFAATMALVLLPMISGRSSEVACLSPVESAGLTNPQAGDPPIVTQADLDAALLHTSVTGPSAGSSGDSLAGLRVFFSRWEMNDFLFLLLVENLKPADRASMETRPWFSVVPEGWRQALTQPIGKMLGTNQETAAFLLTRLLTMSVFVALALQFARRAANERSVDRLLEAAFLTLAWFWLLLPTQNPWYWLWALPLIPFARSRAWLAVAGLVFAYYLRFWLSYHFATGPTLGTSYAGSEYFDFVVTWIEFGPWLLVLLVCFLRRAKVRSRPPAPVYSNSQNIPLAAADNAGLSPPTNPRSLR